MAEPQVKWVFQSKPIKARCPSSHLTLSSEGLVAFLKLLPYSTEGACGYAESPFSQAVLLDHPSEAWVPQLLTLSLSGCSRHLKHRSFPGPFPELLCMWLYNLYNRCLLFQRGTYSFIHSSATIYELCSMTDRHFARQWSTTVRKSSRPW